MTLRSQLFAALSVLFLGVLAGILWMNVSSTRDYLEQQLASHAQDAATSLSMRLTQAMSDKDEVLVQVQVESLFDRGYFQRITVLTGRSDVAFMRELPLKIGNVPQWFTSLFVLQQPAGEAFVSSGWRQLGKVVVVSQPAHAYEYLWAGFLDTLMWIGLVYVAALLMTHGLLKVILNPLSAIERVARAVQEKRFEQIALQPRARELARVVRAMNEMSRRIGQILDAEVERAEGFRRQALVDEVTQIDNRKGFDMRFGAMTERAGPTSAGYLIGLEVNGLKPFNTEMGYRKGDELLAAVARCGAQAVLPDGLAARLGGALFVFAVANTDARRALELAQMVKRQASSLLTEADDRARLSFSMGLVRYGAGMRKGDVLGRLDLAIEAARLSGRNELNVLPEQADETDALGSQGWRDLVMSALEEKRWRLVGQVVRRLADGERVHLETMGRLLDKQGHPIAAGHFVPMATRHHLMPEVDRALLTLAGDYLISQTALVGLAVNLSMQSVQDPVFGDWMRKWLSSLGTAARRLSVELTAYGCSQDLQAASEIAAMVRAAGARFGIDRVGLDPASTSVLRTLPPDYVKLETPLILQNVEVEVATKWIETVVQLARTQGAMVIAQGVESEEMVVKLMDSLHDAGQGFYFGTLQDL